MCVEKRDGEMFYLKPAKPKKSPLAVKGVELGMTSSEIVEAIRESRERSYS